MDFPKLEVYYIGIRNERPVKNNQIGLKMISNIKTDRLTIRLIEEDDWDAVRQIWLDFESTRYVFYDTAKDTRPESMKEEIGRWAEANRSGTDHIFLAVLLDSEMIGFYSLNIIPDGYEIGYGFLNEYQGLGYGKESLYAICEVLKEEGIRKLRAGTALKNEPSVGLLRSAGYKLMSTERLAFYKDALGHPIMFEGGWFEREL